MTTEPDPVRTADDPTKALLSESGLNSKHLCDYVVNVATGCRHGCKFCYVPATPNIRARPDMLEEEVDVQNGQKEWGSYVLYRDNLPEQLDAHLDRKRTWTSTPKGQGIVGVSFHTDCYMDGRAGKITREVVESLTDHERHVRVLTRNPILALQDLDVFQDAGEFVTIGSSIPSMNAEQVTAIEPRAPPPEQRVRGLTEFADAGVNTYVSMSPTYPTQDWQDLREQLQTVAACDPSVVFHEPINPRAGNFRMTVEAAREAGELKLAEALDSLRREENWIDYAVSHFRAVQEVGADLDLPIHLWPDKLLVEKTDPPVSDWLRAWRERQSPECFAGRPTPESPPPQPPRRISPR
jgi:DNA repair photolyase